MRQRGIENARLDSDLLLASALGVERLALFLDADRPVAGEELATFKHYVQRRARREPVAYILGRRSFWQHEFLVTPDVLVPRPETELLVETVLSTFPPDHQTLPLQILEIGIGSGALLCSLLLAYPDAIGVGVDISAAALAVAEENGRRLGCWDRMRLLEGDLVAPLSVAPHGQGPFQVIVSNPPYIATDELAQLEPEVRVWEPRQALDGGVDGLTILRRIPDAVRPFLAEGGLLALEIGILQGDPVAAVLREAGFQDVVLHLDYSRRPRAVSGRWRA